MRAYKAIKEALELDDINLDSEVVTYRIQNGGENVILYDITEIPSDVLEVVNKDETLYTCIAEYSNRYYILPYVILTGHKAQVYAQNGNSIRLSAVSSTDDYIEARKHLQDYIDSHLAFTKDKREFIEDIKTGGLVDTQVFANKYSYTILDYIFINDTDNISFPYTAVILAIIQYDIGPHDTTYYINVVRPLYSAKYKTDRYIDIEDNYDSTQSYIWAVRRFNKIIKEYELTGKVFRTNQEKYRALI